MLLLAVLSVSSGQMPLERVVEAMPAASSCCAARDVGANPSTPARIWRRRPAGIRSGGSRRARDRIPDDGARQVGCTCWPVVDLDGPA
jgi:hypothetical protein